MKTLRCTSISAIAVTAMLLLMLTPTNGYVCPSGGYFCLNEEQYAWCNPDSLGSPTVWTCETGNICKCGTCTSSFGPCNWAFEDINGSCTGSAGSVIADWSNLRRSLSAVYARLPSHHLPFSLAFNASAWEDELRALTKMDFYDDPTLHVPSDPRNYKCSLHQAVQYDTNPSQLWIGKPAEPVSLGGSGAKEYPRLPDAFLSMYLAYAMDQYGV